MTGKETIETIIADIKQAQSDGMNNIDANALITYLEGFKTEERLDHEIQLETFKNNNQINLEVLKTNLVAQIEMFKSVITVGANAARAILIINGGAAIALLAFLGNIWEKDSGEVAIANVALSLLIFCGGVLSSGLCSGFTYVAQYCFGNNPMNGKTKWGTFGHVANAAALILGLLSLVCFGLGAYKAFESVMAQFNAF